MAVAVSNIAADIVVALTITDVRGQTQKARIKLDPALTDAALATILGHLDTVTNGKVTAQVEQVFPVTGFKSPAVDATEANISEMMEVILVGIDPVSGRKVERAVRIGAMIRAIENFPAGSLNTAQTDIAALITALNASYAFEAVDGSIHVGLLQVDTANSHHVTVEDIVDIT